jgi:PAS domain S-box-containing protein
MSLIEFLSICVILIQLGVLIYVFLIPRTSCTKWVWVSFLIPTALMLARRIFSFHNMLSPHQFDYYYEIVSILISISLAICLVQLKNLLFKVRTYESKLQETNDHLEEKIKQRTTQLETTYLKMQRAKKQWEKTFDSVPDAIMILNTSHVIVRVNKSMANFLGMSPKDMVGKRCYKLIHDSGSPPRFCPHKASLVDGKSKVAQVYIAKLKKEFLVSTHPIIAKNGKMVGSVHVARDVTELKEVQRLLAEKKDRLLKIEMAKTSDLLESARLINSGIAHELRTPMQAIMNCLEIVEDDLETSTPDIGGIVEFIHDAEDRLNYSIHVLESLSTYARAGASEDIHLINVVSEIETTIKTLKFTDSFKRFDPENFALKEPATRDCYVRISQSEFIQVITNLCKNSAEAEATKIKIKVECNEGSLCISIMDNGIGVPTEDQDKIFQPYFSTKEIKNSGCHHGLGLPIVKNIVLAYKGEINFKSKMGFTKFTITFPCQDSG